MSCLRCGKDGTHKHVAYAASRGCTETGRVCDPCWRALLSEREVSRKAPIYIGRWSLTKAQGRVGY